MPPIAQSPLVFQSGGKLIRLDAYLPETLDGPVPAVIALHGKPCGEVVSYVVQGENDFLASCKDGNRYRVYLKDGRVVVDKK